MAPARPLRQAKRGIEAPYLKQLVDAEIVKLPEYLQSAWHTRRGNGPRGSG